jgi:RNA polymerase sigma factor (sigma-70 family)|tara:strand:+ start:1950 stop:2708 length:759 start_codon:yes stop_codon:yes gene_type:complete
MKKYNVEGYIKDKLDLEEKLYSLPDYGNDYEKYTREELIIKFLPLVESLARKFSTSQQAIGVLTIRDLIQEGRSGLVKAIDRLDMETLLLSEDKEKTMKSFLSKRIRGAIRRGIDNNRGNIRIPEHKINEIRKNFGKDQKMVAMFFNSIFLSIDEKGPEDQIYDIPDKSEPYNKELLNAYLKSLMKKYLSELEYEVLRLSYGLDCDKHLAKEIASILDIKGDSSYVRVSQLKKQAVQRLIDNVDHSQVLDYL